MSQLKKLFQTVLTEPWLSIRRQLTVKVLSEKLRKPILQKPQYKPISMRMLYVAASSLPYHISGYTTRTHEVVSALCTAGAHVHVLTRTGYPWDRGDRACDTAWQSMETLVDELLYEHIPAPSNRRPVLQYALQATNAIARVAERQKVALIHAASNHVNALPALLAARKLGIPFQYEMRGLWELTRISRMPEYEGSQGYQQGLALEALVASHADKLFVISSQLAQYVQENWMISPEKINLLPNCIGSNRIVPVDLSQVVPRTLGYAGSLMHYEGLDTLIDAISQLAQCGTSVYLNIVGEGEARLQLEAQVKQLNVTDRIFFYGRMSSSAAREILGRCALICIPRKPFQVCKIVPPIKLVEALAIGRPVIVPDLPVFRDEMKNSNACWFFKAGDSVNLASVIKVALDKNSNLEKMAKNARKYAITQRDWQLFVGQILPASGMNIP